MNSKKQKNKKIVSLLFILLPLFSFCQTYTFNRQGIITFENEHKGHVDIWTTPITVQVQKLFVILIRPANGAGEKAINDTLIIKNISKEKRDKYEDFIKIKIKDGRTLIIYADEYITMSTKETRDHKRIEYFFYNQK